MLSPEQIDSLPENVSALYAKLEEQIVSDMARRIVKTNMATAGAQWQFERLRALGLCEADIMARVAKQANRSQKEVRDMFKEAAKIAYGSDAARYRKAGRTPIPLEENAQLQRIISAGLKRTNNLFENLTRTTAKTENQRFENVLDTAYMQITSGAFDYNTAIRAAIKTLAQDGIDAIRYPSGHTDKLDVAVRRAALTGVNQTALQMQDELADEMNCDLVMTSAHFGARPEHAEWQGKIFSRSGTSRKYPHFQTATGYGTGAGLGGWNCRHSFYPYFEGTPNPYSAERLREMEARTVEYNGEKIPEYEATQKQRAMERRIRATKRELAGYDSAIQATEDESLKEALQADFDRKSVVLKHQEAKLKDFVSQTELRRERAREQVSAHYNAEQKKAVAFNRSVSQKSVWANKNFLKDEEEKRIIKEQIRQDILSEKYPLSLNIGNQNKHIATSHSYKANGSKSYIFGDLKTAQELVEKYHGTGEIRLEDSKKWSKKEFIITDDDIGIVIDAETGKETITNRFSIHYGIKGTHIVPRKRRYKK